VDPKSEEYKLGIRPDDRIVAINGKPVSTWQEVHMGTLLSVQNPMAVTIDRAGERKTYDLKATVNPDVGWKILNLDPAEHPEIREVFPDGAGAAVGLQAKDIVLSFANVPLAGVQQLMDLIHIRAGQPTEMKIKRGIAELVLQITPKLDPSTKKGRIGVGLGSSSKQYYRVERPGPTPWASVKGVLEQMRSTFSALAHSKETGVGAKDLIGPVGILASLASQVNTDYRLALNFLILLNVNLAILNLLPIPVLDGGHIMMSIIEKIRRRPVSVRFQEYTTTAFAVLLISFMLYVTAFDFKRFPLFRSMFNQDTQIESAEKHPASPAPSTAK
jgi:regulator of sigma E protease